MEPAVEKIWKAGTGLEQADVHSTAMCHSIIKMMIDSEVVTRQEFARQIQKIMTEVVAVHKKIAKAMREQRGAFGAEVEHCSEKRKGSWS